VEERLLDSNPIGASAAAPFHTFISYNTEDGELVRSMVDALRQTYNVSVWLDEDELPPGTPFSMIIATALARTQSVIVCIGSHGYGKWQKLEIEKAVERQVSTGGAYRVIPVLLPGVKAVPEELLGVDRNTYVQFSAADDAKALFRLCWGITGIKPTSPSSGHRREPSPPTPPKVERPAVALADEAIADLSATLTTGNAKTVTYFVGPAVCWPPSTHVLVRQLLDGVLEPSAGWMPPIDLAASYYAASVDGNDLKLLTKLFEIFNAGRGNVPPALCKLATVLKQLARRPLPRTPVARPLIVTTNFDLMIERALLQAGVSFTRIVQHRAKPQIDVNDYHVQLSSDRTQVVFLEWTDVVDGAGQPRRVTVGRRAVAADRFDELDGCILEHNHRVVRFPIGDRAEATSNPLAMLSIKQPALPDKQDEEIRPWPLLYKHHGSQDIEGSYAVSAEQHLQFMRDTMQKGNVPIEILNQIKDSSILFLGYSFLDPALRLIYNTLLHDRIRLPENRLFSVQNPPHTEEAKAERRIESLLWHKLTRAATLQMGVETIESGEDEFVRGLLERVNADLAGIGL
jgi:hypothetical protein